MCLSGLSDPCSVLMENSEDFIHMSSYFLDSRESHNTMSCDKQQNYL